MYVLLITCSAYNFSYTAALHNYRYACIPPVHTHVFNSVAYVDMSTCINCVICKLKKLMHAKWPGKSTVNDL